MMKRLLERLHQGLRTLRWPNAPVNLHPRFRGLPSIDTSKCQPGCSACFDVCPTGAIADLADAKTPVPSHDAALPAKPADSARRLMLDLGKCLFCPACMQACESGAITFSTDFRLAASTRHALLTSGPDFHRATALCDQLRRLLGRSLKLRQVSAGGCNACEGELNVTQTVVFDVSRFGVEFVASPRHADGIVVTGPVSRNMESALRDTYAAVPSPKVVIAFGACAISGGPFIDSPDCRNGIPYDIPVDLYLPGCPPHPMVFLDGILRLLGRLPTPPA
jgi:Ni,Fe-hydrogenase III small subunit/formate hydrogenlyase subunit 6/NADH:ubiquinone oxidoreductase subunit I